MLRGLQMEGAPPASPQSSATLLASLLQISAKTTSAVAEMPRRVALC